jgi:oxysterol-binding protein-related protein 9/10/11
MFYRGSNTLLAQNDQRQRRRDETASGTTWQLKHFVHVDNDPICELIILSSLTVMCLSLCSLDERLSSLAKIVPPTEDFYTFKENWPSTSHSRDEL